MQMRMGYAIIAAVLAAGLGTAAFGQDNVIGQEAYQASCAVCHGTTGQGDGEFADILAVKPANLTLLSANNNGVFPYLDVFHSVDGRMTIRAHGSAVMPIWGDYFGRQVEGVSGPYGAELLIRAQIVALVDYVESLQK